MKDEFIGTNIKQKVRLKILQMNKDIFSGQISLELIDYLLQVIQTKMKILKDLKLEDIIYEKTLLVIITPSLMAKKLWSTN